jgi:hypothetical protein
MTRERSSRRSWVVTFAASLAVALALALGSAAAPPAAAAAAPRLTLVGAARYVVQPDQRRVHVTVDLVATNHARETISTRYVYDRANLAVLPGSTGFRATNDGVRVGVSVASRSAVSTLLAIRFAKRLGSGRSTSLRLAFELPDPGGPASRRVRVGPSLVAFPVWAFGTRGTPGSTVSVKFPAGYQVNLVSGRLGNPVVAPDGTTTLSSPSLPDPFAISGHVSADRPGAFAETKLDVPLDGATAHLAIRAWQDDPAWAKRVATLLKKSLPALSATIGLPYPQASTVVVEETVARSIDGAAGAYDPTTGVVRLAYTTGPGVTLRQAAHLWFDGSVFADRWQVEGLSSYAADGAAGRLKLNIGATPLPDPTGPGAFPLNAWAADPGRGPDAAKREAYGAAASAALIRLIATRTGAEGLRAILSAARARSDVGPIDWRAMLDLIESEGGVDATDLWRTWVARPEDALLLDQRARLRLEHAALVEEANGWVLPDAIGTALAAWRFDDAEAAMARARDILDARDQLALAAAVAGLRPSAHLRTAFETGDHEVALAEAAVEQAIVEQIVAAETSGAAASSSWLVRIGLLGQDPLGGLAAARSAFEAGDLTAAQARAIGAREAWAGAADLGGLRLRSMAALGLLLALLVLLLSSRARRQPRRRGAGYRPEAG